MENINLGKLVNLSWFDKCRIDMQQVALLSLPLGGSKRLLKSMINLGKSGHVSVYMSAFHMVTGADVCIGPSCPGFDIPFCTCFLKFFHSFSLAL